MNSGAVFSAFMQALREGLEKDHKNGSPMLMMAGPNGSGKSRMWKHTLEPSLGQIAQEWVYINADEEVREHVAAGQPLSSLDPQDLLALQRRAQAHVSQLRHALILSRNAKGIIFETVFSDTEGHKLRELQKGRENGFLTVGVFIGVEDIKTLIARVERRQQEGEHGVDLEVQLARYPRVLENMRKALSEIDLVVLVDNSTHAEDVRAAFRFLSVVANGELRACVTNLPNWAQQVLSGLACPKDHDIRH